LVGQVDDSGRGIFPAAVERKAWREERKMKESGIRRGWRNGEMQAEADNVPVHAVEAVALTDVS
jgi:hypothetical protein